MLRCCVTKQLCRNNFGKYVSSKFFVMKEAEKVHVPNNLFVATD
jgi:hypothetical protein